MDPVSTIGVASSILTFIDIAYKVVNDTLKAGQTGRAPHTEHIDAVAHDLNNAVARFRKPVSPNASDHEKALGEVSVKCQTLSTKLLALLDRFKVSATQPGVSWDKFKVVIRRIRNDSKVQELQKNLAEYRSQILVHLVTILNDRQLETQLQLGNSFGEVRTDLHEIRDALENIKTEGLHKVEQALMDLRSTTRPDQIVESDKLATQLQEVKDVLNRLTAGRSEKTPETRIMEHVYFGSSMFRREETLKPADGATFRWFVEGFSSKDYGGSGSMNSKRRSWTEAYESLHLGARRSEVASRFEKWLQSGSGVFHISGKAGSGKSTLMKLILSTERTHELLTQWAGDKRLLFARFYFWAGGEQMQNSLEGLQRSILFEILIQRPDLVKEVFPEAYSIFAHNNWDSPIHSRFFTNTSFQKAFRRLLCLPTDPRYRLCLFIDGLDEYGADVSTGALPESEREDLAQNLYDWARNDNVKILVSSRPHPEFTETFAEDQRVHLHQLTYDDMIEFGRHLFERHRVFGFPGVKERYHSLVKKVVRTSDGIFLWTGLTTQKMLASLARGDSFESVEKQLEVTPRDLNLLYEKMFLDIDEHERRVAMKMMLLVSEERKYLGDLSHDDGINAMAISWLELLEDPNFPANQPFCVYTDQEMDNKRRFADSRVNGYTRGLLEVITNPLYLPGHDFLRHTVQFFHRTALEYVTSSPLAQDVLASSPNLFNLEVYSRLSLAELHSGSLPEVADTMLWRPFRRYQKILTRYFCTPNPSWPLIEAYRAAFEQQARYSAWFKVEISLNGDHHIVEEPRDQFPSFDHWVANEVPGTYATQYLTDRLRTFPSLLRPQDDLSLLLSVACSHPYGSSHPYGRRAPFPRFDRVKTVLAGGADLLQPIILHWSTSVREKGSIELSIWQAWCLYYVSAKLGSWGGPAYNNLDTCQILELFLESGVDSDCYILMRDRWPRSEKTSADGSDCEIFEDDELKCNPEADKSAQQQMTSRPRTDLWTPDDRWAKAGSGWSPFKSAYVVSFGEFIRHTKPANYERLEGLLGENNCTQEFSGTRLSEIEAELATSKHPMFKFPTVRPIDLEGIFAGDRNSKLAIYWIRWKDATIPGFLEIRLY